MNDKKIQNNNESNSKKILALAVLIVTLMITTTGATYAYFAFGATSENIATGTAASASLSFKGSGTSCATNTAEDKTPAFIAPAVAANQTLKMVPQKALNGTTNVLQKAFTGASGKDKCVDGNGNVICKAYTFTIKNCSSATAVIKGQIKFTFASSSGFTNLKWKLMDSATSVTVASGNAGATATTTYANFDTGLSLAINGIKQYWIIFWIEETGGTQNSTDYGTWYATINFVNNTDGTGITSTIAS